MEFEWKSDRAENIILMYWCKQEQYVFVVILFFLVVFQISTFFIIKNETNFQDGIILVGLNLILLLMMIPYAKWVWKAASYQKAFLQVVGLELILLGISAAVILLAILTIEMKGRT
ncbi:MAG: hypothetical protein ABSA46_08500 [Thermodesulfovibrionales bacterium]